MAFHAQDEQHMRKDAARPGSARRRGRGRAACCGAERGEYPNPASHIQPDLQSAKGSSQCEGKATLDTEDPLERWSLEGTSFDVQSELTSHFQSVWEEMENERNLLREKLSRLEKQELTLIEERRNLQKQLNDLSLNHRAAQIELQRKAEHLERTEKNLQTLQENHQELQDAHRAMGVEVDHLREDVARMDDQLHRETTLRKSLQEEKKTLMAQVQNLVVQLETTRLAVDSTQRELVDVTDHKVRLEGILRDTKSAMQKVTLEQQIEQKSHAQRTAMLEKVISDERAERRNLVNETLEVNSQRADTLDCLRRAQNEITEIKRQRLEYEEEIERQKVMIAAQEQRIAEQLVTVDKYHAVVASHEAEMREIQMLLECEREEAARKMAELQDAFAAAKKSLEQRLDQHRFSYEDLWALICLREDEKSKEAERAKRNSLEEQVRKLNAQIEMVQEEATSNFKRAERAETQVRQRDTQIEDLHDDISKAMRERDEWKDKLSRVLPDVEHCSMGREDYQMQYERIRHSTEVFEEVRASLERQLTQAKMEIQRLVAAMHRQTMDASTQVQLALSDGQVQTDLSYQYLEQAEHLQDDRWRRDRLDSLKRASNFVDDPEEKRDFTVIMRTTAPPVARLEPETSASSEFPAPFPRPPGAVFGAQPSDSWPPVRPPLATPSVSSQKIQAMRRSFPSAGSAGFHVAQAPGLMPSLNLVMKVTSTHGKWYMQCMKLIWAHYWGDPPSPRPRTFASVVHWYTTMSKGLKGKRLPLRYNDFQKANFFGVRALKRGTRVDLEVSCCWLAVEVATFTNRAFDLFDQGPQWGQAQLRASVPAAMPMRKPAASATMAVSQPDEDQVQPLLLWDIWLHCKNPQPKYLERGGYCHAQDAIVYADGGSWKVAQVQFHVIGIAPLSSPGSAKREDRLALLKHWLCFGWFYCYSLVMRAKHGHIQHTSIPIFCISAEKRLRRRRFEYQIDDSYCIRCAQLLGSASRRCVVTFLSLPVTMPAFEPRLAPLPNSFFVVPEDENTASKLRRSASFSGYIPHKYADDAQKEANLAAPEALSTSPSTPHALGNRQILLSECSGDFVGCEEPDSQADNDLEEPWLDTDDELEPGTLPLPLPLPPSQGMRFVLPHRPEHHRNPMAPVCAMPQVQLDQRGGFAMTLAPGAQANLGSSLPPRPESYQRQGPGGQAWDRQCFDGRGYGATGRTFDSGTELGPVEGHVVACAVKGRRSSTQAESKKQCHREVLQAMKTGDLALKKARAMMPAVNLQPRFSLSS
ncbi:unnamed protein product [Durusdinium trenchii]|uniref:Uncharacterized protein n=2 Tax=Durusdinium trenchii TaxID=1381693 RepID=A0ABP0PND3_9DINO